MRRKKRRAKRKDYGPGTPIGGTRKRSSRARRWLRGIEIDFSKKRKRSMKERVALAAIGFAISFAFVFSSLGGTSALASFLH